MNRILIRIGAVVVLVGFTTLVRAVAQPVAPSLTVNSTAHQGYAGPAAIAITGVVVGPGPTGRVVVAGSRQLPYDVDMDNAEVITPAHDLRGPAAQFDRGTLVRVSGHVVAENMVMADRVFVLDSASAPSSAVYAPVVQKTIDRGDFVALKAVVTAVARDCSHMSVFDGRRTYIIAMRYSDVVGTTGVQSTAISALKPGTEVRVFGDHAAGANIVALRVRVIAPAPFRPLAPANRMSASVR